MHECADCASKAAEIRKLHELLDEERRVNDKLTTKLRGAEERINACVRRYGAGAGL